MRGMQKDIPRLHCQEGHRKKDEIPQKSLSVKIWKWRLKILFRCMKNTREPNPAIFLVTPHRISSGTEVKQWWASHSVSILLYHQRLLSPWLQRLIMATFLPISMRLLNCQIAPQHHGLKKERLLCWFNQDWVQAGCKGVHHATGSRTSLAQDAAGRAPASPIRQVSPARSLSIWEVYSPHNPNFLNPPLFWQEERIRIRAGRWKSRIIDHIFYNSGLSGFSGENGLITSPKNYPYRPFWRTSRLSDGRGTGSWKTE